MPELIPPPVTMRPVSTRRARLMRQFGAISALALLIVDGAAVRAQMTGDPGIADEAQSLLDMLDRQTARRRPAAPGGASQ